MSIYHTIAPCYIGLFCLSCLPRWKVTLVTATEDNNDGRQNDLSPDRAGAFLNYPSTWQCYSLKDPLTLTYRSTHDNLAQSELKGCLPLPRAGRQQGARISRNPLCLVAVTNELLFVKLTVLTADSIRANYWEYEGQDEGDSSCGLFAG